MIVDNRTPPVWHLIRNWVNHEPLCGWNDMSLVEAVRYTLKEEETAKQAALAQVDQARKCLGEILPAMEYTLKTLDRKSHEFALLADAIDVVKKSS